MQSHTKWPLGSMLSRHPNCGCMRSRHELRDAAIFSTPEFTINPILPAGIRRAVDELWEPPLRRVKKIRTLWKFNLTSRYSSRLTNVDAIVTTCCHYSAYKALDRKSTRLNSSH